MLNVSKLHRFRGLLPKILLSFVTIGWAPTAWAQASNFEATAGEIAGTVRIQGNNRPASQVLVNLRADSAGISRNVLTDINGRFEVHGLPPDTYEIIVEEPGYEPARSSAQLSGVSSELVVYLKSSRAPRIANGATVSVRELRISERARSELRKGLQLLEKNDPAASLSHFARAVQAFPEYYEAVYHKGVAEMRLGQRDVAMEDYQRAIDLSGGRFAWAQFALSYLLCEEGKPGEAEKVIRKGLEADDSSPEGYVILGNVLTQLKRWDEAERSLQEALLRDPNFADAYLMHSNISASRGNFRAQLQDLDTYLRLEPNGRASENVRQAREATLRRLGSTSPQE